MFFNDWLSRRSLYTPDRVAVVDDKYGRRYTFCELNSRASRLANYLKAPLGVGAPGGAAGPRRLAVAAARFGGSARWSALARRIIGRPRRQRQVRRRLRGRRRRRRDGSLYFGDHRPSHTFGGNL